MKTCRSIPSLVPKPSSELGMILSSSLSFQSYFLEVVLTLESAVDHMEEDTLQQQQSYLNKSPRKVSDLPPLPGECMSRIVQK